VYRTADFQENKFLDLKRVIAYKFLLRDSVDLSTSWRSWVIAGLDYVAQNAQVGDVANMSLGGSANPAVDDAVLGASYYVRFAIAAGNSGDDAAKYSPARVNGSNIFTVSAIAKGDTFASFSNWGNPPVDYAAPGVNILSLYKRGGMETLSGTSMAAPHVAGLLLLGSVHSNDYAINDPDSNPDPIAHH
jgi:subtilisin family serine protease